MKLNPKHKDNAVAKVSLEARLLAPKAPLKAKAKKAVTHFRRKAAAPAEQSAVAAATARTKKAAAAKKKAQAAEPASEVAIAAEKAEAVAYASREKARAAAKVAEKAELLMEATPKNASAKVPRPQAASETRAAVKAANKATAVARAEAETGYDLRAPALYLNRELTWLSFNRRVLHEASDERNPLLERVKFFAISAATLDEFIMKRIGGLKLQVSANFNERTVDGRSPDEQIAECLDVMHDIQLQMRSTFLDLVARLEEHDIVLTSYDELSKEERTAVRDYYIRNIFPLLTPLAMDPAHPFPFISNLSLNLLVTLKNPDEGPLILTRIKVPVGSDVPRFHRIGSSNHFVLLEDIIANNLDELFPGMDVVTCEIFRVTRNANAEQDEDQANDLLAMIESELRHRKFAPIVRLEVQKGIKQQHRGMLAAELELNEAADVSQSDVMIGMRDLMELTRIELPALHDPVHHPIDNVDLQEDRNIFHIIRDKGSILLHHPYESFASSVFKFVEQASQDPKVLAIKMTLYRTSPDTKIIESLINAARNGKQVAVAIELKARFDEGANIQWANRLEEVGVHVTYGVLGLKTHAKLILVVRKDYYGLKRYAHIGTGNYHAGTARLYADFGLLTCDDDIGNDLTNHFNFLTSGSRSGRKHRKILESPKRLKKALLSKINHEISGHSKRSPGLLRFKTNALEDPDITEALYRASQAGVRVELIVRDTCRLRPGLPGLSENITVISIVGRFLEHSRVYYFRNGGNEEFFIGSADLMKRNLENRVEVLVKVENPKLCKQLNDFLELQINDRVNAWEMQSNGAYIRREPQLPNAEMGCQEKMIAIAEMIARKASRRKKLLPKAIARRNIK